jgi:hypothetical protein
MKPESELIWLFPLKSSPTCSYRWLHCDLQNVLREHSNCTARTQLANRNVFHVDVLRRTKCRHRPIVGCHGNAVCRAVAWIPIRITATSSDLVTHKRFSGRNRNQPAVECELGAMATAYYLLHVYMQVLLTSTIPKECISKLHISEIPSAHNVTHVGNVPSRLLRRIARETLQGFGRHFRSANSSLCCDEQCSRLGLRAQDMQVARLVNNISSSVRLCHVSQRS